MRDANLLNTAGVADFFGLNGVNRFRKFRVQLSAEYGFPEPVSNKPNASGLLGKSNWFDIDQLKAWKANNDIQDCMRKIDSDMVKKHAVRHISGDLSPDDLMTNHEIAEFSGGSYGYFMQIRLFLIEHYCFPKPLRPLKGLASSALFYNKYEVIAWFNSHNYGQIRMTIREKHLNKPRVKKQLIEALPVPIDDGHISFFSVLSKPLGGEL